MLKAGTTIPVGSTANIEIAAIRNPDVDEVLTYTLAVMRSGDDKDDDDPNWVSVDYYFAVTSAAFADLPTSYIDFFSMEAYNHGDVGLRGLRGISQYSFTFTIFETYEDDNMTVFWGPNSKFVVNFPEEYAMHPTVTAPENPETEEHSYEIDMYESTYEE